MTSSPNYEQSNIRNWFQQVLINRYKDWKNSAITSSHISRSFQQAITKSSTKEAHALPIKSLGTILFEHKDSHRFKLAMQGLEAKEKAALILYYYQGHSQTQVAEILGIDNTSLENMFQNLRVHLHYQLEELSSFSKFLPQSNN